MDNFMQKNNGEDDKTVGDYIQRSNPLSNLNLYENTTNDKVNHPPHYNKGTIETYDYIVDTLGKFEAISYCQGNIIKYMTRMWHKGKPLEDAKKAEWYLKSMIDLLKETKGKNWG